MAIVCWGNLAKSADDVLRIEQSMENYVSGHNENPNAHMADGYSLFEHRTQDVIDHTFYSVRNIFMYPQVRTYKAIVDPAGYGDMTDIQDAIDYVSGLGGGDIYIKAGTYTQSSDLVLYSNISLIGEDDETTIIDFDGGNYQVKILWDDPVRKRNINIENLTIQGSRKVDGYAVHATYSDKITIKDCYFTDNYAVANGGDATLGDIYTQYCNLVKIEGNTFEDSGSAINVYAGSTQYVANNYIDGCSGVAIQGFQSNNINISANEVQSPLITGYIYVSGNKGMMVSGNFLYYPRTYGIYVGGQNGGQVIGNTVEGSANTTYGIYVYNGGTNTIIGNKLIDATSDGIRVHFQGRSVISGNNVQEAGGYGIYLQDSNSVENVITSNVFYDCTSGGIYDNGLDNEIAHNLVAS